MKGLPWCKLYAEARLDKKLSHLTLAQRGVWVNLLCYASEQPERGSFDASDRFALALECADGDEETLNSAIDELIRVKHLVPAGEDRPGVLYFRTFESRQSRKPSDAQEAWRERQQKSRASRRGHTASRPVTRDNGDVTDVTRLDIRSKKRDNPLAKGNVVTTDILADVVTDEGEPQARKGAKSSRVNPHWDALVEAFDYSPVSASEKGKWGKLVIDLRKSNVSPADVLKARANYDALVASGDIHWKLTPTALVAHLGELLRAERMPPMRASQNGHAPQPVSARAAGFVPASESNPWKD